MRRIVKGGARHRILAVDEVVCDGETGSNEAEWLFDLGGCGCAA